METIRPALPRKVALEIALDFMRSPSAPFGWYLNPSDNDFEIKVGSPYTPFRKRFTTLRKFVDGLKSDGIKISQDSYNRIRGMVEGLDEEISLQGIVCPELFAKWSAIRDEYRPFFCLGMIGLNQMNDLHNFMIPFMEKIGEELLSDGMINGVGSGEVYDFDHPAGKEIAEFVLDNVPGTDLNKWFYAEDGGPEFEHCPQGSEEMTSWVEGVAEEDEELQAHIKMADDWSEEFVGLFAWVIEDIQEAYAEGNLTLRDGEDAPDCVKDFLRQEVLPL